LSKGLVWRRRFVRSSCTTSRPALTEGLCTRLDGWHVITRRTIWPRSKSSRNV
jgi:hypothetical protein